MKTANKANKAKKASKVNAPLLAPQGSVKQSAFLAFLAFFAFLAEVEGVSFQALYHKTFFAAHQGYIQGSWSAGLDGPEEAGQRGSFNVDNGLAPYTEFHQSQTSTWKQEFAKCEDAPFDQQSIPVSLKGDGAARVIVYREEVNLMGLLNSGVARLAARIIPAYEAGASTWGYWSGASSMTLRITFPGLVKDSGDGKILPEDPYTVEWVKLIGDVGDVELEENEETPKPWVLAVKYQAGVDRVTIDRWNQHLFSRQGKQAPPVQMSAVGAVAVNNREQSALLKAVSINVKNLQGWQAVQINELNKEGADLEQVKIGSHDFHIRLVSPIEGLVAGDLPHLGIRYDRVVKAVEMIRTSGTMDSAVESVWYQVSEVAPDSPAAGTALTPGMFIRGAEVYGKASGEAKSSWMALPATTYLEDANRKFEQGIPVRLFLSEQEPSSDIVLPQQSTVTSTLHIDLIPPRLGIAMDSEPAQTPLGLGIRVASVESSSRAEAMGIKAGDIIHGVLAKEIGQKKKWRQFISSEDLRNSVTQYASMKKAMTLLVFRKRGVKSPEEYVTLNVSWDWNASFPIAPAQK